MLIRSPRWSRLRGPVHRLLLAAIDDQYLAHLKNDVLGYQPVTVREIIDCIDKRYLQFDEDQKAAHPQPPTPIVVDNSTAAGIANKTLKQRRSKAMDMRFYWVQDRIEQKQFLVYWRQGAENLADYFTKHHPARYHVQMRPVYLHSTSTSNSNH